MQVHQQKKLKIYFKMNVLWVHDHIFHVSNSGNIYSPGKLPYEIWNRYLTEFDSVHVIARCKPIHNTNYSNFTLSSGPNVSFTFLPSLNLIRRFFFNHYYVNKSIKNLIKKYDAVIARLPSFNGELAIKAAIHEKKPYAIELVACPWDAFWNYGNWKGRFMAPRSYLLTRFLVSNAPYVLYVTNHFLQRRYPNKGHSISVSNVLLPVAEKVVLSQRLSKIDNKPFLTVGLNANLGPKHKGIHIAIKAINILSNKYPSLKLKILGSGSPRQWIDFAKKNGVHRHIEFCGFVSSGQEVLKWLDNVDLYIQPSLMEGLPRALLEAMSRGCPALGSTVGGIPELLPHECLHKPGDFRKLSKDIEKAYHDIAWRKHHAKRNFDIAKNYTKRILDDKRTTFWKDYASFVRTNQKIQQNNRNL